MSSSGDAFSMEVPDPGPVPQRLTVDLETVQQLVEEQFPHWSQLPVTPVPHPGWDNLTFRLGEELLVRLPSAAEYALAVEKEHRWLPAMAEHLPVRVPVPMGLGLPGAGYPFHWSIYGWIPGEPADTVAGIDPEGVAQDVGDVLAALRGMDTTDGPQPGVHNWFRGATLRTSDSTARNGPCTAPRPPRRRPGRRGVGRRAGSSLGRCGRVVPRRPAPGNLLLGSGRMVALIDFGTCGVGDPSCDLAIAWTLLDRAGGQAIRERLDLDASTWARGRGWALWKSLSQLVNAIDDHDEAAAAEARRVIDGLLEDYSTGPCPRPTNGRRGHAPTTSRTRRPTVTPSGHSSTKHAGTRCHDQHDDAAERVKMTVAGSRTKREATPQLVEGRSGVCRHSELNVRCGTYAGRRE